MKYADEVAASGRGANASFFKLIFHNVLADF